MEAASSTLAYEERFGPVKRSLIFQPYCDILLPALKLTAALPADRNYSSPVEADLEKGIKVLDVGCGGGTWVLEMANTYSNSNFTGIDVSATWPTEIRPRNTDFVVGNVIHELPFEDNAFDFVYMRFLGMGVPNYQYPIVLASLFRVLKPGGWIELVEIDGAQQYKGEKTCQFYNALLQYLASRGFKDGMVTNLDQKVLDAGFVNIDGTRIRIPLGSWGGKLGVVFQEDVNNAYVSLRPIIQPILKFSDEEFEAMLIRVQEENNEEKQEANWFSFWAQKPIN
ncbi:S-adenosyl-L-methionine-dependent methyltransferase [Umbelopsis sp. PMI_123]|nr:S-adenosyl-L-methionine-dependent methyltransferase [Umbelopsis sp. PMI_123]